MKRKVVEKIEVGKQANKRKKRLCVTEVVPKDVQVLSERLKKQNTLFRLNRFKIVRVVLELLYVSHSSK